MKYAAINIGPIVGTISMARKPRELWAASYLFSFLMECIIKTIKEKGKTIISPASVEGDEKIGVGLYPDRIYLEDITDEELKDVVDKAFLAFAGTGIGQDYVNVMYVSIESEKGEGVIRKLNQLLDCTELYNRPVRDKSREDVLKLIQEKYGSSLFRHAFGNSKFEIQTLGEIATYQLSKLEGKAEVWENLCAGAREKEENNGAEDLKKAEDEFYKKIKVAFKEYYHSYHKYICVVQADGDNMGSIISALKNEEVMTLSAALLEYGKEACQKIRDFGGLPIYAGGDDLLFLAPVVSDKGNIFGLLSEIDGFYKETVDGAIDKNNIIRPEKDGEKLHTSLSYGLSVSYYKYPLYEALKSARESLFDTAKNVQGKDAIAWCLRKHSGTGFSGSFCKNASGGKVYQAFTNLMGCSVKEETVSAIAHKLRQNEDLLEIIRKSEDKESRMTAFYHKVMEEENPEKDSYLKDTRGLLCALFDSYVETKEDKEGKTRPITKILTTMYGMLRTAKFINGEGDEDE